MTQRLSPDQRALPLAERLRLLAPSPDNQTCECAGDYQCACCVIGEAHALLTAPLGGGAIERAAVRMALVENNEFKLKFSDLLRQMARAAIEAYRAE